MSREQDAQAPGNQRTIASYEVCAADYAKSTEPMRDEDHSPLQAFLDALAPGDAVLEIGSGPGWDADWLEQRGLVIRRTDVTVAFLEIQRARGRTAELLDVVTDDLGGPYAGVIARYVFQHIDRPELPRVFAKIARALKAGGAFLFSLREGDRDLVEQAATGPYHIAEWRKSDLDPILTSLGFEERWSTIGEDSDGRWLTMLTVKDATA